jgi:type I restriction enzyme S subunit
LEQNEFIENNFNKGACNKSLDVEQFNKFKIPVPPLQIQEVIVKELNEMYEEKNALITSLNNIHTGKKSQFELMLDACENIKAVKLGEICTLKSGKFNSKDKKTEGKYKFYTSDAIQPSGYIDDYCFEGKEYLILIKDGGSGEGTYGDNIGLGKVFLIKNEKTSSTSHQIAMFFNCDAKIEYLKYFFEVNKNNIMDLAKYTIGLGCISMEKLNNFDIKLPSIEDQNKIIVEMEEFDTLKTLQNKQIVKLDKIIKNKFDYHLNKCKNAAIEAENKKELNSDSEDDESEDEQIVVKPKNKKSAKGKQKIKRVIESDNESSGEENNAKSKKIVKKKVIKKKIIKNKAKTESDNSESESEEEIVVKHKKLVNKKVVKKKIETESESEDDT